jgi:adenylate cyclase
VLGVLYMESPQDQRFGYDDEDALVALAGQLGMAIQLMPQGDPDEAAAPVALPQGVPGATAVVRHYAENDSVFLDDDYLIKGVAGSIFCALVRDYLERGRVSFSNRELRLDRRIRLPDLSDNLEARLILLGRRLVERNACVRIEKTGRGRFELRVDRPLQLVEMQ